LEVPGIGQLEKIELSDSLAQDELSFASHAFPSDGHGDLGVTTAVVVVSLAAIKALAPLLVRRKQRQVVKKTDEYTDREGVRHVVVTEITFEAEYSEADVLKALATATNVDVAPLIER
jgi:hypothetical protein